MVFKINSLNRIISTGQESLKILRDGTEKRIETSGNNQIFVI